MPKDVLPTATSYDDMLDDIIDIQRYPQGVRLWAGGLGQDRGLEEGRDEGLRRVFVASQVGFTYTVLPEVRISHMILVECSRCKACLGALLGGCAAAACSIGRLHL